MAEIFSVDVVKQSGESGDFTSSFRIITLLYINVYIYNYIHA